MPLLMTDPDAQKRLIRERRKLGIDRYDEVWNGVYFVSPPPNDDHQRIVTNLSICFGVSIQWIGLGEVRAGIGVSDRTEGWTKNYRCPDVAVFLRGTSARNLDTHWFGGPDFAVEILSRGDRARKKFGFYASVGTRELLPIDRQPWALELHRLEGGDLGLAGRSTPEAPDVLVSQVLPLSFRMIAGDPRPAILVAHADGIQTWSV